MLSKFFQILQFINISHVNTVSFSEIFIKKIHLVTIVVWFPFVIVPSKRNEEGLELNLKIVSELKLELLI